MGAADKRAFQVRLEPDEGDALEELVKRRAAAAAASGATVSASGVLRAIVRKTLVEEGLLVEARSTGDGPEREGAPPASTKKKAGRK